MIDRILDLFRADPFAEWPEQRPQRLTLDLNQGALNGVRLGDEVSSLRRFGKPSEPRRPRDRHFVYNTIGCEIGIDFDAKVNYFGLVLVPVREKTAGAREADLTFLDQTEAKVDGQTLLNTFIDRLGQPVRKDEDPEELIWCYTINGNTLEIEAAPDGRIRRINLFPE